MTDYEAAIQAEASASKELRLAAEQFAKRIKAGAMLVANWGDGQGSNAIDAVRDALIEAQVFKPTEPDGGDGRRKLSYAKRKAVFERDLYRCVTCGSHIDLTIDHRHPMSLGGGDELGNLQTMRMPCTCQEGRKGASMSRLLINEPPLQVLPSLAVKIGLNEAIILQQVHYWLDRSKTSVNGHLWVYHSVSEWRTQFPFWSDDTIVRALKSLRARGVVIAEQLSPDARDRSLYYRIDYSVLSEIDGIDAECTTATCGNGRLQSAAIPIKSRDYTDTSPNPRGEREPDGFAKFWSIYPSTRKVGKKSCLDKWRRKGLEVMADEILQHVEAMKLTKSWVDGFDPSPQTYLAQERWGDGVPDDMGPSDGGIL